MKNGMLYKDYEDFYLSTGIADEGLLLLWLTDSTVDAMEIIE